MAVLRTTGHNASATAQCSGLNIARKGGTIYFWRFSGFFPKPLSAAERAAISVALEAEFGMPAMHGTIPLTRPGGGSPGR